jgi:hypothetical protein
MSGWVAGAIVVTGATSAYMSSKAAKDAANTQAAASDRAIAAQQAGLSEQQAISAPFVDKGTQAMNRLAAMTEPGGEYYDPFSQTDFKEDPGYAFRLKEGMKALNSTAAARGGLISGNALRAATGYGQELGSQEYQNAFNRYYTERTNKMDPLKFLTGVGQAAGAGQASNIGAATGNIANLTTGAGNAMAAGQVGAANAYTNAMGQGISQYQTNQLLNRYAPQPQTPTYNYYGGYGSGTEGSSNFIGPTQN